MRSRAARDGRAPDAQDSFSELTVHLGLSAARERRAGDHHEIEAGPGNLADPPEPLPQEPPRPVPLDGAADPPAHGEAEAVEGPSIGGRDEQEQPAVEAGSSLEDGVEVGPRPQALAGPEAHRGPRCLKPRDASDPSAAVA
jgi:hypothetical protein